jgi:hypothetical protein
MVATLHKGIDESVQKEIDEVLQSEFDAVLKAEMDDDQAPLLARQMVARGNEIEAALRSAFDDVLQQAADDLAHNEVMALQDEIDEQAPSRQTSTCRSSSSDWSEAAETAEAPAAATTTQAANVGEHMQVPAPDEAANEAAIMLVGQAVAQAVQSVQEATVLQAHARGRVARARLADMVPDFDLSFSWGYLPLEKERSAHFKALAGEPTPVTGSVAVAEPQAVVRLDPRVVSFVEPASQAGPDESAPAKVDASTTPELAYETTDEMDLQLHGRILSTKETIVQQVSRRPPAPTQQGVFSFLEHMLHGITNCMPRA